MTTTNVNSAAPRRSFVAGPIEGGAKRAPRVPLLASALSALLAVMTIATPTIAGPAGVTGHLNVARIGAPTTGGFVPSGPLDATFAEFPAQLDEPSGPGPYPGVITNRSLSHGHGNGESSPGHRRDDSNVEFISGFEGLNIYQQRYARGGNQFTVEPPDQGLCAGNGYVMEVVNDVLNVYNRSGQSVLPDNTATNVVAGLPRDVNHAIDLNSFYGYAPAINRSTGVRSQFVTDPSCLFDKATQRWFVVVLTLETLPNGADTGENHIDIAVSTSANPTGSYNIYKLDVTADGTDAGGQNPGPYLGDYPHIGADANGFYVTTNAYPWCCSGFGGAQIYALSKRQLAAGSAAVNVVHIDTTGMVNAPSELAATQPGFTVWPAESPGAQFSPDNGGTEYFMSSNAAAEAVTPVTGSSSAYTSTQLVVWTLSNTASLNTTPALQLTTKLVNVNRYGMPPRQHQPGAGGLPGLNAPLGHCIDDVATSLFNGATGCWRLLFGRQPRYVDVVSSPDSNDTRMQKVMYANGKLWGALDTALNPDGGAQRAGIAWYVLNPKSGSIVLQGYLGATGYDFAYPTMGITTSGRGLISFTASGDTLYPSAAYVSIDAYSGVGDWHVVRGGQGGAVDDGFSGYVNESGFPRTRWGDYGATAVDGDLVWMASEYIASNCAFTNWGGPFFLNGSGDNLFGTCAPTAGGLGRRVALANWSTRISLMEP